MQAGDVVSTYADVSDLIEDFDYKPDTKILMIFSNIMV
jgi:UDP-glucuronate 4-epimerase